MEAVEVEEIKVKGEEWEKKKVKSESWTINSFI